MTMTQLQRDALERARKGDWELADAMEIDALSRVQWPPEGAVEACMEHGIDADEVALVHGVVECGRIRALGYGHASCATCEGAGEIDCDECGHTNECKDCDGIGGGNGIAVVYLDLNGNLISETSEPKNFKTRDVAWARELLREYHADQIKARRVSSAAQTTMENTTCAQL